MNVDRINNILKNTKEYIMNPSRFSFNDIALDLYDLHRAYNDNYKKYSIGKLDDWHNIPLVPSSEFITNRLQLNGFEGFRPTKEIEFLSRGKNPKHHILIDTEFFRTAISTNFLFIINNFYTNRIVFLDQYKSNSLLSYIYEHLCYMSDFRSTYEYVDPNDPIAVEKFIDSTSVKQYEPLVIIGTPNQFYQFKLTVDSLTSNPLINVASGFPTIVQFGDYIELSKMDLTYYELNNWLNNFFHASDIIQVYYNNELSSQLLRWGEELSYFVPHTVNVRVIDTVTGKTAESGVEGNLAFIDIANVWSCPFIISDDLGIMYNNPNAVQITRRSDSILTTGVNPK